MESSHLINKDALFRYMSLEILKSVPGDIQDALARLALLQDFSEPEAAEILNIHDIKSLMEQCLDFRMFVQRIPGVPMIYRFHSLFREFLLYILHDRYAKEQIDELHLRAAEYYMQHDTFVVLLNTWRTAGTLLRRRIWSPKGFNKFMIGETGQLKMAGFAAGGFDPE